MKCSTELFDIIDGSNNAVVIESLFESIDINDSIKYEIPRSVYSVKDLVIIVDSKVETKSYSKTEMNDNFILYDESIRVSKSFKQKEFNDLVRDLGLLK